MAEPINFWIDALDGLAKQANASLATARERASQTPSDYGITGCLVAIADQLAYGNAVSAATFDMQNRRFYITPDKEKE